MAMLMQAAMCQPHLLKIKVSSQPWALSEIRQDPHYNLDRFSIFGFYRFISSRKRTRIIGFPVLKGFFCSNFMPSDVNFMFFVCSPLVFFFSFFSFIGMPCFYFFETSGGI